LEKLIGVVTEAGVKKKYKGEGTTFAASVQPAGAGKPTTFYVNREEDEAIRQSFTALIGKTVAVEYALSDDGKYKNVVAIAETTAAPVPAEPATRSNGHGEPVDREYWEMRNLCIARESALQAVAQTINGSIQGFEGIGDILIKEAKKLEAYIFSPRPPLKPVAAAPVAPKTATARAARTTEPAEPVTALRAEFSKLTLEGGFNITAHEKAVQASALTQLAMWLWDNYHVEKFDSLPPEKQLDAIKLMRERVELIKAQGSKAG
jgi:hypothetical protein